MSLKEKKALLNAFVIIYLISFLFFNWEDVSWLFNYKFISRAAADFFQSEDHQALPDSDFDYTEKENRLEIPKIGVSAPLLIGTSSNYQELEKELDRGVVYFPDSVPPGGEKGQTVILGHSAPLGWPKINYDWVFNDLNKLKKGDKIFLHFEHKKYVYQAEGTIILNRGEEVPKHLTDIDNMLVLVSCWPPGKDSQRIAVWARGT